MRRLPTIGDDGGREEPALGWQSSRDGDGRGHPSVCRSPSAMVRRAVFALAACAVLLGGLAPVIAQGPAVRVTGRVQWIAAEKMMLIPNDGGLPVEVDITQVGQDQYETLTEGSPVTVVGVISPDGRKIIATSIISGGG